MRTEAYKENLRLKKNLKTIQGNLKFTEVNELEWEHKAYSNEIHRLKNIIKSLTDNNKLVPQEDAKALSLRIKEQSKTMDEFNKNKTKLILKIKAKESEIKNYEKELKEYNINIEDKNLIKKYQNEINMLNKEVKEIKENSKEKELKKVKGLIEEQQKRINELKEAIEQTNRKRKKQHESIELPPNNILKKLKETLGSRDIKKLLFEYFKKEETVSLHELLKIFIRPPCNLSSEESLQLSKYLIEIKGNRSIKLTKEKPLDEVLTKLYLLIDSSNDDSDKSKERSVTEDHLISVFKTCIMKVKEQLNKMKITAEDLFSTISFIKNFDNEDTEFIRSPNFFKLIKEKLNIEFNETEKECLENIMHINDYENLIKLKGLLQIIKEFEDEEDQIDVKLDYSQLDDVSMVIIFALTEYMIETKLHLEKIFEDVIYHQLVDLEGEQLTVDLMDSFDFFKRLNSIGVSIEEKIGRAHV